MNAFIHLPTQVLMSWLPVLLDAAAKSFVIFFLAGGVAWLLRRSSASVRHLVWMAAIFGVLCLPVLSLTLPQWRIPLLPRWAGADVPATAARAQLAAAARPALVEPMPMEAAGPEVDTPTLPAPSEPIASSVKPAAPVAVPAKTETIPWPAWVLLAWAAGVCAAILPLLIGRIAVWRLARHAKPVRADEWPVRWDELCHQVGAGRVALRQSQRSSIPFTYGIIKPTIVLPREAANWSADRLHVVLLHELAHAARRDCLMHQLAYLACSLYWFNPLAWLALKRLQSEAERACDDRVLAGGHKASEYAQCLLDIASNLESGFLPSYSSIAMARPNKLEGRLLAILDGRRNRRRLTGGLILLAAIILTGLVVPLALLKAAEKPEVKPAATQPASQPASQPIVERGAAGMIKNPAIEPALTPQEEQRVRELVYILRNCVMGSRTDEWAGTIQELTEIGPGAVPELVSELNRTQRDATMRTVAYTLRVIGDPRAVPYLIYVLDKAPELSSDLGLAATDRKVHAFMAATGLGRGEPYPKIGMAPAVRQATAALEKITSHSEGEIERAQNDSPEELARVRKLRGEAAVRWRAWWEANRQNFVATELRPSIVLPFGSEDWVDKAGLARFGPVFPSGTNVKLGPVTDIFLPAQTVEGSQSYLDLDTGRQMALYEGGYKPAGNTYDPSIWIAQNGIDGYVQTMIIDGDKHFYVFGGTDAYVWDAESADWDSLEKKLSGSGVILSTPKGRDFVPGCSIPRANLKTTMPWTFFFTTPKGGRGILQILESSDNPPGVRLRYRLIQADDVSAPTITQPFTQPMTTVPSQSNQPVGRALPASAPASVDVPALVRQVRDSEQWIHGVKSFYIRMQGERTIAQEKVAKWKAEHEREFPGTPWHGPYAKSSEETIWAFDADRVFFAIDPNPGYAMHRAWNGKGFSGFEQWSQEPPHYYLDNKTHKEDSGHFAPLRTIKSTWLHGEHSFWWDSDADRYFAAFYRKPAEDFTLDGTSPFRGQSCYVLRCYIPSIYRIWYVSVKDHRLAGVENYRFRPGVDQQVLDVWKSIARQFGATISTSEEYIKWIGTLPPEQQRQTERMYREGTKDLIFVQNVVWMDDYREVAPGCWMPMRQGLDVYDEINGKATLAEQFAQKVVDVRVNQELDPKLFEIEPKEGDTTTDLREVPNLTYPYKKDRTAAEWDKIRADAREQAASRPASQPVIQEEKRPTGTVLRIIEPSSRGATTSQPATQPADADHQAVRELATRFLAAWWDGDTKSLEAMSLGSTEGWLPENSNDLLVVVRNAIPTVVGLYRPFLERLPLEVRLPTAFSTKAEMLARCQSFAISGKLAFLKPVGCAGSLRRSRRKGSAHGTRSESARRLPVRAVCRTFAASSNAAKNLHALL